MNMESMSPAAKAFAEANAKMHKDMTIQFSGNADVDFARSMIPHHQGAIDMAEDQVSGGTHPEAVELAQTIIDTQQQEIDTMRDLLTSL